MGELTYWVADWNLTRAEGSMLLGGGAVDMLDCIGGDLHRILATPRLAVHHFAGYVTGSDGIAWTSADFTAARGDGGTVLAIDQSNLDLPLDADVKVAKDVESGASQVNTAVKVAGERLRSGRDYTIYCERSMLGEVEAAVASAGLAHGEIVGYQYASPLSQTTKGCVVPGTNLTVADLNCDLSVMRPAFLEPAMKAAPAPSPHDSGTPIARREGVVEIVNIRHSDDTWVTDYRHGAL
jgi:hypothetical protein